VTKPVVIFGLGSYAQVAQVYLEADSPHEITAFTANEKYIEQRSLNSKPVVPFESLTRTYPPEDYSLLVAIGPGKLNDRRTDVYQECKALGYAFISYVNSKAIQWGEVSVGENTFIFENNVLQPFVEIGSNTVLWSGNHIGHHTKIGDNCFITSHAVISGHVTLGNNCFVGVNATLVDNITVASYTLVGAGAMITKDTSEESAYVGQRAEKLDRSSRTFRL